MSPDLPPLLPPPQLVERARGTGSVEPFAVERWGAVKGAVAKALVERFSARLPGRALPAEGYLLEVRRDGAVAVAADPAGEIRARQTLRQLPRGPGAAPRLAVADWPAMRWRGLHVLDSGSASLPAILRLVRDVLAVHKCNTLVYEIDYDFAFVSHPELAGPDAWTRTAVGELVAACRAEGVRVIPEINCLGHQSWRKPPGALLAAHPDFEEPPDGKVPQADVGSDDFYCRSWCPRHPKVHPLVFDLVDELVDAFGSDAFHCGMDEVFVIASSACPRCKGADPAQVYADAIRAFHDHLAKRGKTMLMWGDRLLDGKATGYGDWEAATNGTAPALDRIPTDIVVCDWHYEDGVAGKFPSLDLFARKGFTVWPTTYKNLEGSKRFLAAARAAGPSHVLGSLASIWYPAAQMTATLFADGAVEPDPESPQLAIARTAVANLDEAWAGR